MTSFIYQIEKQEKEHSQKLFFYKVENSKTIVEHISKPYHLFVQKSHFEALNINSDNIILANKKFYDKNHNEVVQLEIHNKELYQYLLKNFKEVGYPIYEEDLPVEHQSLIEGDKSLIEGSPEEISLKTLSIDIETIGEIENQEIVLISTYTNQNNEYNCVYINKKRLPSDKLKEIEAHTFEEFTPIYCEDEKEVLNQFREDVVAFSPQILLGWNVIDFDFKIIKQAMKKHNIEFRLSSLQGDAKMRIAKDFFGKSSLTFPGVIVFDVIQLLKTNFITFDDYKLNTVAQEVLSDEKIDLENEESDYSMENKIDAITSMLHNNPIKLIEYNFKDSYLTQKIVDKLQLLELMIERSAITNTPLVKVQSPIASLDIMYLTQLRKTQLVADSNFNFSETSHIEGAYVIDPEPNFYKNVAVLDFKSLYPSIIMTFNIDPFTYCEQGDIIAPNRARFKKQKGILPGLIDTLFKEREKAKKQNNGVKSFALKITMNSFYGAVASPKSRFYNRDIGEAITSFGREILKKAKNYVEKDKENFAVYGDSVVGDTKIWIKNGKNGSPYEVDIKDIFSFKGVEEQQKQPDGTIKYYKHLKNIYTLTMDENYNNVWKLLNYVIKHKTSKKLYKIWVNNQQFVTLTQDHSLIDFNFYKGLFSITPRNATKVIYNYGFEFENKNQDNYLAQFLGFWIGDGHLENNGCNIRISAGNDSKELIQKLYNNVEEINNSKIYQKPKGDLDISNKKLSSKMEEMGFLNNWDSKTKRIPEFVFQQEKDFIFSFLKGLFSSDGTILIKKNQNVIRYTSINENLIKDIQRLLMQVGIGSTYFKENNSNNYLGKINNTFSYHLVINSQKQNFFMRNIGFIFDRKNNKYLGTNKYRRKITTKKIVKKEELPQQQNDVYDLNVENYHRFYGNNILLKNTDSLFVSTSKHLKSNEEKKQFGKQLESQLNSFFKQWCSKDFDVSSRLIIEMEKFFSKFFIASKKRYVGYDIFKQDTEFTGLEAVRGDWTKFAKQFQVKLVDLLFNDATNDEIKQFFREEISKLQQGDYDDLLVYRKKLSKPLESYTKTTPPHVKAAREVSGFSGKVVDYVMTKQGPKHVSLISKNDSIDYNHYIEKQLKGVSDDFLKILEIDFDSIVENKKQKSLNSFFN